MEFISARDFDSEAKQLFWEEFRNEFTDEDGFCWHKYPVTNINGRRFEPDVLILHPEWGLHVIEIKGCFIRNIEATEGHTWYMRDWYNEEISPQKQAENQM